jgi:UDP-N-acetylglucosamine--N-acetylmuramyl-(pentapeptide) pyrophosphoryl-undecaprenol N-acetylglucosamine transferase
MSGPLRAPAGGVASSGPTAGGPAALAEPEAGLDAGLEAGLDTPEAGEDADIVWVGGVGGMEEELVRRAGLPFAGVHAGGLHGVGWLQMAANGLQLIRGTGEALGLVRRFRPAVLLVTGGFASVPVAVACRLLGVPSLVYLPDVEPGQAVRFLSRLAARVAVSVDASRAYFPASKPVVVTGYPVRPEFRGLTADRGRAALGLRPDLPVLLVFGGSRGARSLNAAVIANLHTLLAQAQIVHVSGTLDHEPVAAARAALRESERARYHVYPYLHAEMGAALAAADLVVARAGASTLGEFPLFGLPAILVPYPHAWRYQRVNADYLVDRGAALRVDDAELGARLAPLVTELLGDRARLGAMRAAARALAVPDAAERLARELLALGTARRRREGRLALC